MSVIFFKKIFYFFCETAKTRIISGLLLKKNFLKKREKYDNICRLTEKERKIGVYGKCQFKVWVPHCKGGCRWNRQRGSPTRKTTLLAILRQSSNSHLTTLPSTSLPPSLTRADTHNKSINGWKPSFSSFFEQFVEPRPVIILSMKII